MTTHRKPMEPRWLLIVTFFIAGLFAGSLGMYLIASVYDIHIYKVHSQNSKYNYINPLIAVDSYENKLFSSNKALELKVTGFVTTAKNKGTISSAAIYFRDIEPGSWFGINENTKFSPGRFLKIPIMIAYFKLAESDPASLEKTLVFSKPATTTSIEIFGPSEPLLVGQSYKIQDLIERMVVNADNDAATLLYNNLDREQLTEIFTDLGIEYSDQDPKINLISLKLNSLFYRTLYNATYLNREYSEKALALLVQADNSIGLSSGLPKEIAVANRYSGKKLDGMNGYEMSDCGIVYYPSHPYLLCAIAQGKNLENIKGFLHDLGITVYEETDYQYKK